MQLFDYGSIGYDLPPFFPFCNKVVLAVELLVVLRHEISMPSIQLSVIDDGKKRGKNVQENSFEKKGLTCMQRSLFRRREFTFSATFYRVRDLPSISRRQFYRKSTL